MQLETKFLRLRTPVTLGSRFDDWNVCWLGGWGRYRLYFLVMVVKLPSKRTAPFRLEGIHSWQPSRRCHLIPANPHIAAMNPCPCSTQRILDC